MQGTSTPHDVQVMLGEIKVIGPIHDGQALNTLVTPYERPSEWFYKQFVSQAEFDQFVRDNSLVVTQQESRG